MVIKHLKKYYSLILILLLSLVLFFSNHKAGTFLMGWDNLMPELNISLNIKRSLVGVWASYRGLGFLNGMSDIANLPHTISIFILSLFFPKSDLRFIFTILAHLAGGFGFYFISKRLTRNSKSSLAGTLFYMLNIGTIQMFFAPLEAFSFQFLAIPLGALMITKSLENPSKKNLLLLFLGNIFFAPQYFVPTFFIVYLLLFFSFSFFKFIDDKNWKSILTVSLVFFASSAFWLIPYVYSGINESKTIQNTRINEFASPEIYYRSKSNGDLKSVFTFKGFMLDAVEYDPLSGKNYNFMQVWQNHYNKTYYQISFFLLLIFVFLGIFYAIFKKKGAFYPYLLVYSLSFVFLANNTFPFDKLNEVIRTFFPSLGQAFRFPFTKFEILFVFSSSIFLTLGVNLLTEKVGKLKIPTVIVLSSIIILLAYPAFNNNFFSSRLKLKMPEYYSQMFDYLNFQDENKRIALLPLDTFWDWRYNSWGNFGSGFIWYGIPQPVLSRAFDPWSNYNEQFYNELEYAVNTQNTDLFEKTLNKYDISYLLLDESFINALTRQPINYASLESFIKLSKIVTKEKQTGKLILYKVETTNSSVYALEKKEILKVYPSFSNENEDAIQEISKQNNYIVDSKSPDIIPMFPSLYSGKLQKDIEFKAQESEDSIILISNNIALKPKDYLLRIPSLFNNDFLIPVKLSLSKGQIYIQTVYPKILIDEKNLEVKDEPIILTPKLVNEPKEIIFNNINNQVVALSNNAHQSYLLKNSVNTIELINGTERESISFDTNNVSPSVFFIHLPNKPIKKIKLVFPKIENALSSDNLRQSAAQTIKKIKPLNNCCESFEKIDINKQNVSITAKNAQIDLSFYFDSLFHQGSYIIFIKTKYESGLPINFYIDNPFQNRSELYTRLSISQQNNTIILPKTENYFRGYGLHLTVKSVGSETAKSDINKISLYPIPSYFIKGIALVNPITPINAKSENLKHPLSFKKINDSLYIADSLPKYNAYITLSQSFDSGWKAYEMANGKWQIANWVKENFPFLFGKELKNHVLVNNWANGWALDDSQSNNSKIVIIFWPQYLEYLGFALLIGTFAWLFLTKRKRD